MFRVYSNKTKSLVRYGIYLAPNGDLFASKKSLFGREKLSLISEQNYTIHRDIGLFSRNAKMIFEGDICKSDDPDVIGVVTYIPEHASYYLLNDKTLKYYPLTIERCIELEIIGNVIENPELIPVEEKNEETEGHVE